MKNILALLALVSFAGLGLAQDKTETIVDGLKNPESAQYGFGNRLFVTEIGEFDKDDDGRVVEIVDGKIVPFATGMAGPKGMVIFQKAMFVTDGDKVWKVDEKGKASVFAAPEAFPTRPLFLNDICADEKGILYVSDSGNRDKENPQGGAIFRIDPKGKVTLLADSKMHPQWKIPNGVVNDGMSFLLMVDFGAGKLWRVSTKDGTAVQVPIGDADITGADSLIWDLFGRLYITSWKQGKAWGINRPGEKAVQLPVQLKSAADGCVDPTGKWILIPDMLGGKLVKLPVGVPGYEVDDTPLPVTTELAFPNIKYTGWDPAGDDGKVRPLRPIFLTHAGDGTNRVFVTLQQGPIHVFPNDNKVTDTKVFLDLTPKVFYSDKENEQGLLGLAFHPKFKTNGEFFVFYTVKQPKLTNVLSRFTVSKDDPNKADPKSEEELFRINHPFWNHDGGTIAFGPDGYLYVSLGDGGSGGDPLKFGQNMSTILGKILRIDVDKKADGKNYSIPADNPFVKDGKAKGEIWAYGFRNPWRISFDKKTGDLWVGDVGQNLYEEIDIVKKGENFGWSKREGLHPFGVDGEPENAKMAEPIWEYSHDLGKSITGGNVYRGKALPVLEGLYLYGDYISNKTWGLKYDAAKGRVVANRPIDTSVQPYSFGQDEMGEVYMTTQVNGGSGIYRFVPRKK